MEGNEVSREEERLWGERRKEKMKERKKEKGEKKIGERKTRRGVEAGEGQGRL